MYLYLQKNILKIFRIKKNGLTLPSHLIIVAPNFW